MVTDVVNLDDRESEVKRLLRSVEYVRALDVPADAVLAVKMSLRISADQAAAIQEAVSAALPGRKVLVLPPEMDLIVVRDVQ